VGDLEQPLQVIDPDTAVGGAGCLLCAPELGPDSHEGCQGEVGEGVAYRLSSHDKSSS
jgi:hypothetical protein